MAKTPTTSITRTLHRRLLAAGDAARASAAQAYMKSTMPYAGVPMADVRAIARDVFADLTFDDADHWAATVRAVWRGARVREERYAAIALARLPRHWPFRTPSALPLYEELIVSGAWWDFVDEIATHLVGELLASHPKPLSKTLTAWSRDADLWKRRTAIIAQLSFRERTDADSLFRWIEPSLTSTEFFLRKAIGWALREYSKSAPDVVRRYVVDHADVLSPLSRREALKVLDRVAKR
jgi:3-methyladenine DNA glycosylase AlkD